MKRIFLLLPLMLLMTWMVYAQKVTKMRIWAGNTLICQKNIEQVDSITFVETVDGVLNGEFSVSESKKVHFSQGNLQYRASTDTWRFAEEQYDIIGNNNGNVSSSYNGWIDLFGWGTGNNPTKTGTGSYYYDTFVDWGTNAISNGGNEASRWHTLSQKEWEYLIFSRTNAATLFGLGSVNGVNGVILLPDNWSLPNGLSFTASTTQGLEVQGNSYYNGEGDNFSHNTFTINQWYMMESAGAVFLPAAGYRWGIVMYDIGSKGYYWSTTPNNALKSYYLVISPFTFHPQGSVEERNSGMSVRLVR